MKVSSSESDLTLSTGWLCLDFANTALWHASHKPKETLYSYDDLVGWTLKVGLITESEGKQLLKQASSDRHESEKIYYNATVLREAIYNIFSATAANHEPKADDLMTLNSHLSKALVHMQLTPGGQHFDWKWIDDGHSLDKILWPVVHSASTLLTSTDLIRVGECADDKGCGWVFYDKTRNRSRRWCDMKGCGNRDKVRRYYKKKTMEVKP